MIFLGIGIGVAATLGAIFAALMFLRWRFLYNRTPNWSEPGWIARGSFGRFEEALQNIFPAASARSYVLLEPNRSFRSFNQVDSETKFFIRSAGKRKGQHRFKIELRLAGNERDKANRATLLLERLGLDIKRTGKSHGQIIFETAAINEYGPLLKAAREFQDIILNCAADSPVSIHWHIAGYNGQKK